MIHKQIRGLFSCGLHGTIQFMGNELLSQLWIDIWEKGLWAAPWSKAVGDLSVKQATWRPEGSRKCIWEFVSHVTFWRDFLLDRESAKARPSEEEIGKMNFALPVNPTEAQWNEARAALKAGIERIAAAAKEGKIAADKLAAPLAHDAYHLGQVMYLRALQGLPPID